MRLEAHCGTNWRLHSTKPSLKLALAEIFGAGIETVFFLVLSRNRPLRELFWKVGARLMGSITPRKQQGAPVDAEMYALRVNEWTKENGPLMVEKVGTAETSQPRAI